MPSMRCSCVLAVLVLLTGSASADKCKASKLKSIAKLEYGLLKCHAKAAATGDSFILAGCTGKADEKFATAFAKAGSCAGNETTCETLAHSCSASVRNALPDAGPSKCEAARLRIAGKQAAGVLKCNAKAAATDATVDAACIQRVDSKYQVAFAKTAGCTGDQGTVDALVDERCVRAVRADSTGGATVGAVCDSATSSYAIVGDTNGTPWRFRLEALDVTCSIVERIENSSPGIPSTGDPVVGAAVFTAEFQRLIQAVPSGFIAPSTGTNVLEVLYPAAAEVRVFGGSLEEPLLLADTAGPIFNPSVTRIAGSATCPVVMQCGDTYPVVWRHVSRRAAMRLRHDRPALWVLVRDASGALWGDGSGMQRVPRGSVLHIV